MSQPIAHRKPPRLRAPIDVTTKRRPTDEEFADACAAVDWLGSAFLGALCAAINEGLGRPGSVPARAVLVAWMLNAFEEGSRAEHSEVVSQLVACSDSQLERLGMQRLPVGRAYQRVWDKTDRVLKALELGFDFQHHSVTVRADLDWLVEVLPHAVLPSDLPWSRTRSVDGTDWETCGRFVTPSQEYDGATPPDTDTPLEDHAKTLTKTRRRLKDKVELGPDDRAIYTTDVDARAGHRSANKQHRAGIYIGYELHLSVQVRDCTYAGHPDQLTYGPDVPNIITSARLVPAGAHRGLAAVPMLQAERVPDPGHGPTPDRQGAPVRLVVWDRGYSLLSFNNAHGPLRRAGIDVVFELTDAQRKQVQVLTDVDWIDGAPFSKHTPAHLRDLPRAGRNDSAEERRKLQARYDERARWRYSNHGRPGPDGRQRLRCPFCAGRLRATNLRQRSVSKSAPLVTLPEGVERCCGGVITVAPEYLTLTQGLGLIYGTTAWTLAYGPRVLVETANSLMKDKYAALNRTYTKLMGLRSASSPSRSCWRASTAASSGHGRPSRPRRPGTRGGFSGTTRHLREPHQPPPPETRPAIARSRPGPRPSATQPRHLDASTPRRPAVSELGHQGLGARCAGSAPAPDTTHQPDLSPTSSRRGASRRPRRAPPRRSGLARKAPSGRERDGRTLDEVVWAVSRRLASV